MNNKDYYTVLGLDPTKRYTYSEKDISKAYRALCKLYHPDYRPNDPIAAEAMKTVNTAHDALRNVEKKADYDRELDLRYGKGNSEEKSGQRPVWSYTEHFDLGEELYNKLAKDQKATFDLNRDKIYEWNSRDLFSHILSNIASIRKNYFSSHIRLKTVYDVILGKSEELLPQYLETLVQNLGLKNFIKEIMYYGLAKFALDVADDFSSRKHENIRRKIREFESEQYKTTYAFELPNIVGAYILDNKMEEAFKLVSSEKDMKAIIDNIQVEQFLHYPYYRTNEIMYDRGLSREYNYNNQFIDGTFERLFEQYFPQVNIYSVISEGKENFNASNEYPEISGEMLSKYSPIEIINYMMKRYNGGDFTALITIFVSKICKGKFSRNDVPQDIVNAFGLLDSRDIILVISRYAQIRHLDMMYQETPTKMEKQEYFNSIGMKNAFYQIYNLGTELYLKNKANVDTLGVDETVRLIGASTSQGKSEEVVKYLVSNPEIAAKVFYSYFTFEFSDSYKDTEFALTEAGIIEKTNSQINGAYSK